MSHQKVIKELDVRLAPNNPPLYVIKDQSTGKVFNRLVPNERLQIISDS